ncbi:MAG: GatB/YqeY domain-containing protein [Candidatus Marinimicrobia bacterium]|nr:GatB/YqeY domain-containing protein [Candidatus Neomarinimicrobiota bacterium]
MSYIETIQADLKAAMLNKESEKVKTLRMLLSKLREKKIALMKDLEEKDELAILKKAAKERQDSILTFSGAGREDLANIEKVELNLIMTYLPPEMDDTAIEAIVKKVIADIGASSMADMGRVMGLSMKEVNGQADGKRVQNIVRKLLGA